MLSPARRTLALCSIVLGSCIAAPCSAPAAKAQAQPSRTVLYTLETTCSLNAAQGRCTIEAFDGTSSTVYRTRVNGETLSFRLVDEPERRAAQLWDGRSKGWIPLDALSMDFATNTLCINGEQLCMVNPNYFASIRADHPGLRSDLIMARFDAKDARLTAICYSRRACEAGF